jgi:hypothetical protein
MTRHCLNRFPKNYFTASPWASSEAFASADRGFSAVLVIPYSYLSADFLADTSPETFVNFADLSA